jgi:hypothetical protein
LGLDGVQVRGLGDADPTLKGQIVRSQTATFTLDKLRYAIKYSVRLDADHGDRILPSEGYVGMPLPSPSNWYHGGFMFILLDGDDIGARTALSSMTVAQRGDRAILDLVWHDPAASVRVRFLALPAHDNLYCEVAVDPRRPLKSVALRLSCFPSYFTSYNHRQGARRIQTPRILIQQGQRPTLPAQDHWWSVYYDEIFDVAKGEGDGPCGLLLLPQEPRQLTFNVGDYAVTTRIEYPPATRRMHLAFWDFHGRPNAEALDRLRRGAVEVRQELAGLDFTPAAVHGADLAALRSDLQRALASKAVRERLGQKAARIRAWLDEYGGQADPNRGGAPGIAPSRPGIQAQERLLEALRRYQDFVWEVKLAELLSRL